MTQEKHEWIEDHFSFEAVLRCTTELGQWDMSATLRAYQTFGWNDASTTGDELTFAHVETGVVVRHDGGVVAIVFGDGKLSEALGDLFSVLSALGWVRAEVFHPAETLGALLGDMGSAIPAHMHFDVSAADMTENFNSFPESSALVEKGRAALRQGGLGSFHETALAELESMGSGLEQGEQTPEYSEALHQGRFTGSVALSDDSDESDGFSDQRQVLSTSPREIPAHQTYPGQSGDDTDLPMFLIPEEAPSARSSVLPEMLTVPKAREAVHEPVVASVKKVEQEVGHHVPTESTPLAPKAIQPVAAKPLSAPAPVQEPVAERGEKCDGLVKVGLCTICFDLPDNPVSIDAVSEIVDAVSAQTVVHVWPGLTNQPVRWDVLNEIDADAPWFAEKLACAMGCGTQGSAMIGSLLRGLKSSGERAPQFRDVVLTCLASSLNAAESTRDGYKTIESVIGANARLLYRSNNAAVLEAIESFAAAYGGLLLAEEGQAFVDVRHSNSGNCEEAPTVFTVKGILQSSVPTLYVVHVDALDGPFVLSIVKLLRWVANTYGASTRYEKVVQANIQNEAILQKKEAVNGQVKEMVGGLLEQLRGIGIQV
jgi:hypothetical protein